MKKSNNIKTNKENPAKEKKKQLMVAEENQT